MAPDSGLEEMQAAMDHAFGTLASARRAVPGRLPNTPQADDANDLAIPSLSGSVSAQSLHILSAKARGDMAGRMALIGGTLLLGSMMAGIAIPLIDFIWKDRDVPDVWIVPVTFAFGAGLAVFVLYYLSVMGFGKVSLSASVGDGGKSGSGRDGEGTGGNGGQSGGAGGQTGGAGTGGQAGGGTPGD